MQVDDDRNAFLAYPHMAVLATIGPGNCPHAMPVWYLYEDRTFIVLTGCSSQKKPPQCIPQEVHHMLETTRGA
jgi:nitroimidazol reductase NimA-like FMN-containing flavoprotein (pyridoxamine 5'-phosphate oxidase superfamily)